MTERVEIREKRIGFDREAVTPLDEFRGARFAVGTIVSGASVSGGGTNIYSVVASSVVRARLLNVELYNHEIGWLEVEFRDGIFTGGRVLGPYRLNPLAGIRLSKDEVVGRYFTSSIHGIVLSGYTAQPLSTGVKVNVSFVLEPLDLRE